MGGARAGGLVLGREFCELTGCMIYEAGQTISLLSTMRDDHSTSFCQSVIR